MALTPEEVINKRFQPTKFKEGYNPEEVDDFLDEIVIELRRLNAENASLKRQLEEAEAKSASAPAPQVSPAAAAKAEPAEEVSPAPAAASTSAAASPAAAASAASSSPSSPLAGSDQPMSPSSATGLLAMAQKVHDDYVFEGKKERERLITEGKEEAEKLVSAAQEKSDSLLGDLEKNKSELEVSVAKLRSFEKQYRSSLREYLSKQLVTLDETPTLEPKAEPAQAGSAAPAPNQQKSAGFGQRKVFGS